MGRNKLTGNRSVPELALPFSRYVYHPHTILLIRSDISSQAVWSLLWIGASTWGLAYIPAKYRPNIAALAVEAITCLWWLVTLGLLGSTASVYASAIAYVDSYSVKLAKRTPYTTSDSASSSSSTDAYTSSVASSVSDALNLPDWRAGTHATQGATAVAALNWSVHPTS